MLLDPVYTIREPGMLSLKCGGGASQPEVEIVPEESVVKRTELLRPYPNPFNPTATIEFALKNASHVRLSIYDVRGCLVADLENGTLEAGRHVRHWTGENRAGQRVASGVYFAQLHADGQVMTKRLLMVK